MATPHSQLPSTADAHALLDHSSDGILTIAASGTILYANPQAERLFRRRAAELTGLAFWTLASEARTAEAAETLERALTRGLAGRFEIFHPGLYAWHAVTAVPLASGAALLIRDVTDRMRLLRDDAVRQGIADVIATIPVAISITRGPEHRFEIVNAFARDMLKGRDVLGLTLRNAFPELAEQGIAELFDNIYTSGEPYRAEELEVEFRRGADTVPTRGTFDAIYQPMRDLNGEITGILSVSVEITEQVKTRRKVEAMAREREAVLEHLELGVIISDQAGRIRYINRIARELHGRVELDVAPDGYTDAYDLLTEDGKPFPPLQLPLARAVVDREEVRGARWVIRRPDGSTVTVVGDATPVANADGTGAGAVLTMQPLALSRG